MMEGMPGPDDEWEYDRNRIFFFAFISIIVLRLFRYNGMYPGIGILSIILLLMVIVEFVYWRPASAGAPGNLKGTPRFLIRSLFIITGIIITYVSLVSLAGWEVGIFDPVVRQQLLPWPLVIIIVFSTILVWVSYLRYIRRIGLVDVKLK